MTTQAGQTRSPRLGAHVEDGGVRFSVWSSTAERIWVCIFDEGHCTATATHELMRGEDDVFSAFVPGLKSGVRYGLRADGEYDSARGYWFDPSKLLTDPYATQIDYPYQYNALLAAPRWQQCDTAPMMPKAVVPTPLSPVHIKPPLFQDGGLIYELNVRSFTMLHPDIPPHQRGTIAALAHPAIIAHFKKIGVSAVELMPMAAWIDERHLQPLGLRNAWGYNPVSFMALDPRIAPGSLAELRETVAALHAAGIGVVLDVVFNHTGESDAHGPTLSLRGLDNKAYFRHGEDGALINDTGTGNTLACDNSAVRRLVLDSMRHFVAFAGVDGFRFDLAPILGRGRDGFHSDAPLLREMLEDDLLRDRLLIAEPWDIGPGGYQLGNFPPPFLEWNDRFRDDVRRFWRGDGRIAALATRLAGSSDIFARSGPATRSVNFIAAHDGMTLADLTAYEHKQNEANGEDNRDGHDENLSWNNGVEGVTDDPSVSARRKRDIKALLSTLFLSRGAIMLTAGDEFGRTQHGNNNAYAIDDKTMWLDWSGRDVELEDHVARLAELRQHIPRLRGTDWLGASAGDGDATSAAWLREDGLPMQVADWEDPARRSLSMVMSAGQSPFVAILVNGSDQEVGFNTPATVAWVPVLGASGEGSTYRVPARTIGLLLAGPHANQGATG